MRRNTTKNAIGLLSLLVASGVLAPRAMAQESPTTSTPYCTLATVSGNYGLITSGTLLGVGPISTNGVISFNGRGGFVYTAVQNTAGVISSFTVAGTYTLNQNCFGTLAFDGYTFTGVVVGAGSEVLFQSTNQSLVETGDAKKI